jgi:hypothetical protein
LTRRRRDAMTTARRSAAPSWAGGAVALHE